MTGPRMLQKLFAAVVIVATLAGCSGPMDKSFPDREGVRNNLRGDNDWAKVPALRRIPVGSDLFLARSVRAPMPGKTAAQDISLRFNKGSATVNDLIGIMDFEGIPVIIRPSGGSGLTPDDIAETVLPFRRFDGTLGGLVKKLSRSLDLAVWWENDALYISDRDRYVVSVPQQQDVMDIVVGELEDFGAEDIAPSLYGGRIVYSVRPQVNEEVIIPYLNGLAGNLAEITLQLAVVQLQITDQKGRGIDWSSFKVQFGDPARAAAGDIINGVPGQLYGITGIGDVTTATGTNGTISVGSTGEIGNTAIGISGAIKYLSQFGRTSTKQMVELRTLAGMPVSLVSSESIPYVKGISSTTSTASNSDNVTSNLDTATVDTGLNMSFTPFYDSLMGLVVVDVSIQVSSFLGFQVLTYGSTPDPTDPTATAPESISQPRTQTNQITDIVRIPAGEVVILGGVQQVSRVQNRTAPFDAFETLGSRDDDDTTTLNFFIMRPVVTIFDPKGSNINTTLPGEPIDSNEKEIRDEALPVNQRSRLRDPATMNDTRNTRNLNKTEKKNLDSLLEDGFAGNTGLETQGGP